MKDLITYIPDLTAFRVEAENIYQTKGTEYENPAAIFLSKDEDGNMLFNTDKVPVHYQGDQSLCLIRTNEISSLEQITSMEIIGECVDNNYVFVDGGQAKYEATYDTTTQTYTDEYDNEIEYTPPYMIGVFA